MRRPSSISVPTVIQGCRRGMKEGPFSIVLERSFHAKSGDGFSGVLVGVITGEFGGDKASLSGGFFREANHGINFGGFATGAAKDGIPFRFFQKDRLRGPD